MVGELNMTQYIQDGGPCTRQCDIDSKTLVCKSCGMYFTKEGA